MIENTLYQTYELETAFEALNIRKKDFNALTEHEKKLVLEWLGN